MSSWSAAPPSVSESGRGAEPASSPSRPERVVIGIGELAITTSAAAEIVTHGLGSCVAVCLWDSVTHVAGMLHFLLPEASLNQERAARQPATFADTGIPLLFQSAYRVGAVKARLRVYLLGGAAITGGPQGLDVGRRNGLIAKKLLSENGVLVAGESLGGTDSRTVRLSAADGRVRVTRGRHTVEEL